MYKYQNIPRDVGEGMKTVLNTVGSIVAAPLTLPGVRTLTKTVIKGGMMVSGKTQSYYKQVEGGWEQLIKEAKEEVKGSKEEVKSKTETKRAKRGKQRDKNYEDWHIDELYELAQQLEIKGRSTMNKQELIKQIRKAEK